MTFKCTLVYVSCPSQEVAQDLAIKGLKGKLCACANISSPVTSFYIWNRELKNETEYVVFFKTTVPQSLMAMLQLEHPYDVPAIIALEGETTAPFYRFLMHEK